MYNNLKLMYNNVGVGEAKHSLTGYFWTAPRPRSRCSGGGLRSRAADRSPPHESPERFLHRNAKTWKLWNLENLMKFSEFH